MMGNTPSSDMALQLAVTGVLYNLVAIFTYFSFKHIRNLEAELPDHDQMQKLETQQ